MFVVLAENVPEFGSGEARRDWEEEQRRLDRAWYSMDEGYDDTHNPFSNCAEHTRRKEKEMEQRKKKVSAQQRQINKVGEREGKRRLFCGYRIRPN